MEYPDGTVALEGVDLDVRPGQFVSVVGPSGCGKSTLLRLASRLEHHTSGEVAVDPHALAYVFQDATLLPWRSVKKNVALFCELRGDGKADIARRVQEAIDLVGLTGFENHYPHQLSGGMRMRASVARCLTVDPGVFLFDEPFGALDEISRQKLNDDLQTLFHAQKFAALFVTHSIAEAVYLSTEVVVMSGRPGRILDRVPVPFAYPRDPQIRYSEEFAHLCARVSQSLAGKEH
ncbi:ABC transporter ATP-binding protein [Kineosporia succinea]